MGKRNIGHVLHKIKLQNQLRSAMITTSVLVHKGTIDAARAEARIKYDSRLFISKYGISMFLDVAKEFCDFASINQYIKVRDTDIKFPMFFEPLKNRIKMLSE
jgi:hypothetical protein